MRLVLVRHAVASGYDSPDARLSARGLVQAAGIAPELERFGLATRIEAFVGSPLTRSLQTLLAITNALPLDDVPILITPLARERVSTLGDVGRPGFELATDATLAPLSETLRDLSELWWESPGVPRFDDPASAPGSDCADKGTHATRIFVPETTDSFRARVLEFRNWLLALPYNCVCIVGHAVLFQELDRAAGGMQHCQIKSVLLSAPGLSS
jgi:broad specificity phosphatase PhoE